MNKKIIAIALFAVMLLSLIPIANAATSTIVSFNIMSLNYADQTDANAATSAEGAAYNATFTGANVGSIDRTGGLVYPTNSSATISGKYSELLKVAASKFDSAKTPTYKYEITLDGGEYDSITVNGVAADVQSNVIKGYFQAKQGGNTQDIALVIKSGSGSTIMTKTFSITYKDTESAGKTVKGLTFNIISSPTTPGDYRAYVQQGVLCIDYASDLNTATAVNTIGLTFFSDNSRIPATSQNALFIIGDNTTSSTNRSDNKMFVTDTATGLAAAVIKNDETTKVAFNINPSVGSLKVRIEDKNYYYQSESVKIQWRAVPRNEITSIDITERNVTLTLGETKKLGINPSHATTYDESDMRLVDTGYASLVYIDGMSIKGLKTGTTRLKLDVRGTLNGVATWKTIDMITVTVVEQAVVTPVPPIAVLNQYRVIARSLNVRTGPGTSYAKSGTVFMNNIIEVRGISNGWAMLSNGTYVSAKYIVAVTSATNTGNYTVSAKSLNVRTSANGKIVGTLSYGSVVAVTNIVGGWAQLSNGTWVSALYLR